MARWRAPTHNPPGSYLAAVGVGNMAVLLLIFKPYRHRNPHVSARSSAGYRVGLRSRRPQIRILSSPYSGGFSGMTVFGWANPPACGSITIAGLLRTLALAEAQKREHDAWGADDQARLDALEAVALTTSS